jgi:antitoxin component of RelBE/YafQ-DinJ toxin-antitoxin module
MSDVVNSAPIAEAPVTSSDVTNANMQTSIDAIAKAYDAKHAAAQQPQAPAQEMPVQEQAKKIEEKKAEAKKLKQLQLKVYGETVTEELPFEIDDNPQVVEYLTKQLQMSKAAQRAMQEKGSFEKQVQSFVENLKGNTEAVLAQMGIDPTEFAAKVLQNEIDKSKLTPEQKELQEYKEKAKKLEAESKRKEAEFQQKEFERNQQLEYTRIENEMLQTLEKSDLPTSPFITKRIAEYMYQGLQHNVNLSPADVLPLVREDYISELQSTFKGMSPDKVEAFIGKELFNQVRKKNVAKAKSATPATVKAAMKEVAAASAKQDAPKADAPKINARNFFGF